MISRPGSKFVAFEKLDFLKTFHFSDSPKKPCGISWPDPAGKYGRGGVGGGGGGGGGDSGVGNYGVGGGENIQMELNWE